MEEQSFKLDIYNKKVCDNLFNCQKDEKFCRSMVSKLVFYNREEILDMHSKHMQDRDFVYDVSTLQPVEFLQKNEKVDRVIPLESHWIAVFFADKKTKQVILNKVMYIASDGDGYFSEDVESALNGIVPEEIYLKYKSNNPNGLLLLDERYKDGTHDEFLKKMNDIARAKFTRLLADIVGKPDLVLEDLSAIISKGFKNKKENPEEYEQARLLDFIYWQFGIDLIVDFDKKYSEKQSDSQPGDTE